MAQPEDLDRAASVRAVRSLVVGPRFVYGRPDGDSLDRNRIRTRRGNLHGLLDDGFSCRAAHSVCEGHSKRGNGADHWSRLQDAGSADRYFVGTAWLGLAAGKTRAGIDGDAVNAQLQRRAAAAAPT